MLPAMNAIQVFISPLIFFHRQRQKGQLLRTPKEPVMFISTSFFTIPVDGHEIVATEFKPVYANQKTILINSATGLRQGYYRAIAQYLAQKGYTVYTYDYRSIGKSKQLPVKSYDISFSDWGQKDFPAVARFVKGRNPGSHLFLIGHSVGGNCLGLSEVSNEFTGIITVASHHGYWKHNSFGLKILNILKFAILMPLLTLIFGYCPTRLLGLGDNLSKKVAREWAISCLNKRSILSALDKAADHFASIERPMLMISIEGDSIASPNGVDALAREGYKRARVTRKHISKMDAGGKNIGHVGLFKKEFQSSLWEVFPNWIEDVISTESTLQPRLAA